MKKFLNENWYRLMIGASMLIASVAFLIQSITPATAKDAESIFANPAYRMMVIRADSAISVRLSPDQLHQLLPTNEDGSINIRLSDEQLKKIEPNELQAVDLQYINGWRAANYSAYTLDGYDYHALGTRETDPW